MPKELMIPKDTVKTKPKEMMLPIKTYTIITSELLIAIETFKWYAHITVNSNIDIIINYFLNNWWYSAKLLKKMQSGKMIRGQNNSWKTEVPWRLYDDSYRVGQEVIY